MSGRLKLRLPDFTKKFYVYADASNYALGASLMQKNEFGELEPINFMSHKFTSAELNYSITEKELMSVVFALLKWRYYLHLVNFKIITDHKALLYFSKLQKLSGRLARWNLILSQYDYEIEYIKGERNHVADYLSREVILEDLKAATKGIDIEDATEHMTHIRQVLRRY
eukprot:Nk52_evm40s1485 gene=Nk52_evmTU40s1485